MAEKPEDLNLPNSIIARIIKEALPDGVIVAKDARSAMAKAASVFVLYVASTANNNALKNKRKTISTQDVFEAITEMDLEQFIEPLKSNLEVYKEEQKRKKEEKRKSKGEEANKINEDSELVDDTEVATETIDDD